MPTERMFIALTLPEAVREVLATLVHPAKDLNWTRPAQMHVTVRFVGDVEEAQQERMIERLATVRVEPFILPLEGLGTFPPDRPPRVIFLGVGSGHPRLFQLRQRIDDAILACGLPLDVKTFHPHVTLARCTPPVHPATRRWLHDNRDFAAPPIRVEAFDLYSSELRPTGAVHTLRASFPLAPAN